MFLKSLKWRRLFSLSAWRAVDGSIWTSIVVACLGIAGIDSTLTILCVLRILLVLLLVWLVAKIMCPEKVYVIASGKVKVLAYKLKASKQQEFYELDVIRDNKNISMYVQKYEIPFKQEDATYLTFCFMDQEKSWTLWDLKANKVIKLGTYINKILFTRPSDKGNKICVMLSKDGIKEIECQYMEYDNIYIPKGTKIFSQKTGSETKTPDNVLLVKQDDKYQTYGFYVFNGEVLYREIVIVSFIFREKNERVLVQYNTESKQYQETFRCADISRKLNDYFIEMTEGYRIGGNIYRYNNQTNQLEKIYTGGFSGIEFDCGEVLGDDGKTYGI